MLWQQRGTTYERVDGGIVAVAFVVITAFVYKSQPVRLDPQSDLALRESCRSDTISEAAYAWPWVETPKAAPGYPSPKVRTKKDGTKK